MADDLGDDWWEDKQGIEEGTAEFDEDQLPEEDVPAVPGKRKQAPDSVDDDATTTTVKKKRRRRKRITDEPTSDRVYDSSHLVSLLHRHFTDLSAVEAEDMRLEDEHFCRCNADKGTPFALYLKEALPKWRSLSEKHDHKLSPLVVVVCGNALRACKLNTDAQNFKGKKCKSLKLFSRHMKIEDQTKALKKDVVHFVVGTPARLKALIQQDSMTLDHTLAFIVDINWRDVKHKTITDIPEVRKALLDLLKEHVIPACKSHSLRIGLF